MSRRRRKVRRSGPSSPRSLRSGRHSPPTCDPRVLPKSGPRERYGRAARRGPVLSARPAANKLEDDRRRAFAHVDIRSAKRCPAGVNLMSPSSISAKRSNCKVSATGKSSSTSICRLSRARKNQRGPNRVRRRFPRSCRRACWSKRAAKPSKPSPGNPLAARGATGSGRLVMSA